MDNVTYRKINGFTISVKHLDGRRENTQIKDAYLICGLLDYAELVVHRPFGFYSESALLKKLDTTWNISDKVTGTLVIEGKRRRRQDVPNTRDEAVCILQDLVRDGIITEESYKAGVKSNLNYKGEGHVSVI